MAKIITLSGIDGSGKSTCEDIIKDLLYEFGAKKIACMDSMKPGALSNVLKQISVQKKISVRENFSPSLINIVWMADLLFNYEHYIQPALNEFDCIILHRSELCCRTYSKLFNPDDDTIDIVLDNHSLHYDMNIFLNIAPSIAYERICKRNGACPNTEKESIELLTRADSIYKEYISLPRYRNMVSVDTGTPKAVVKEQLRDVIKKIKL